MEEFEINDKTYRVSKLNAKKQFHIVRRLSPVLGTLAAALDDDIKGLEAIPSIANAISTLSDNDADYCIFNLLSVIKRKQDKGLGWGPITTTGDQIMYDDITLQVMMRLVWKSLYFNFHDFFQGLPLDLTGDFLKLKGL